MGKCARGTCQSAQNFCKTNQNASSKVGSSPWPTEFKKDDIIIQKLPKDTFYKAFDYVMKAAAYGKQQTSGNWSINTGGDFQKDFIYADQVNLLIDGIESLDSANRGKVPKIKKDDVIYAEYFTKLAQALSKLQLNKSACDHCNNACVDCNNCIGCYGCQSPA